ncbi:MAG: GNAT family N-acetyltransferase [Caldilineaceae bacterium]
MSPLPAIDELAFRTLDFDNDLPAIVAINNHCWPLDGRIDRDTLEARRRHWRDTENFHAENVLIVQIGMRIIGYATVSWQENDETSRWFFIYGVLLPEWRRRSIGRAVQEWLEMRCAQINQTLPSKVNVLLDTYCFDVVTGKIALLKAHGFHVEWRGEMMECRLDIPAATGEVPPGIEVRAAQLNDVPAILEALMEGHQDTAGRVSATEAQVRDFIAYHGEHQLGLWQVAWDKTTNEIAAVVIVGAADGVVNPRVGTTQGDLSNLSTRHAWRRRGIAKFLILRALEQLRQRGVGLCVVGVYDNNASAIALYRSVGFLPGVGMTGFQKRLATIQRSL